MKARLFFYDLEEKMVAQYPAERRDDARLLIMDRAAGTVTHSYFRAIRQFTRPGDLLVVNDTRVVPARLQGSKVTGGRVEVLLLGLDEDDEGLYLCLIKGHKVHQGTKIEFPEGLVAEVVEKDGEGVFRVALSGADDLPSLMERVGKIPLPPYVRRVEGSDESLDRDRYQTVFAENRGAVAAPTAGLHFTPDLLDELSLSGVLMARVTLHVSYGSFLPIRSEEIEEHRVPREWFRVSEEAAIAVNRAMVEGRRVIATGTTTVRALESACDSAGRLRPATGTTDLYITPGYPFVVVSGMITNFHYPGSSLLVLVAGFAGRERLLNAYHEAKGMGYRFLSYGDAMLIL